MKRYKKFKNSVVNKFGSYKPHGAFMYMCTAVAFAAVFSAGIIVLTALSFIIEIAEFNVKPLVALAVGISLFVVIATAFLYHMIKKLFSPLEILRGAANKISQGDYSVRVEEKTLTFEVKQLLEGFNLMAEKLEHTEMFRNDFISNFSHEFKTPIVSIQGFAKQLKNEKLSPEQRMEYIDTILSSSDLLVNLSSQILTLSKFEKCSKEDLTSQKSNFFVDEQIRSCVVLFEKIWTDKNIELDIDMDSVRYDFNEDMLFHVWYNLLSNAFKFTGENGKVSITLKKSRNEIVVHIKDNGIGMDEQTVQHIFEKFFQGDSSHSVQGYGLGMCIAANVVKLCDGTISVESEPGVGSDFCVVLPTV